MQVICYKEASHATEHATKTVLFGTYPDLFNPNVAWLTIFIVAVPEEVFDITHS